MVTFGLTSLMDQVDFNFTIALRFLEKSEPKTGEPRRF